jgi:hypothetical protein
MASRPRRLCDDGAKLLHPHERRLFDQAPAAARQSPDQCAWVYDGDLAMCVNLRLSAGSPPRWGLDKGGAHLSGGMVYEAVSSGQETHVAHQPRVTTQHLPPIHIHHDRRPQQGLDFRPATVRMQRRRP